MTPGELREVAKIMNEFGLTRVVMGDTKIVAGVKKDTLPIVTPGSADHKTISDDSDVIKHKVEEMSSLLKMNDLDLVDRLFPDMNAEAS